MVLGKHSGRNAFKTRLEELGHSFETETELNHAFANFKELADKKHEIYDEDLHLLVSENHSGSFEDKYELVSLKVTSCTGETPEADLVISVEGKEFKGTAQGSGPVDASFKAIESIVNSGAELQLYSVNAITSGTDSQGEVTVRLDLGGKIVNGLGADTDIVIASAKAYLHALNLLGANVVKAHPQTAEGV